MKKHTLIGLVTVAFLLNTASGTIAEPLYTFQYKADTGLGYSDNLFHAPRASYQDLFAGVPVSPTSKSGLYFPLKIKSEVSVRFNEIVESFVSIDFNGRRATSSDFSDFTAKTYNLGGGLRLHPNKTMFWKVLELTGAYKKNNSIYFDHDNGLPKITSGGLDISTRDNYRAKHLRGHAEFKHHQLKLEINLGHSRFDHDDPIYVSAYSKSHNEGDFKLSTKINSTVRLNGGLGYQSDNYDQRPARRLDGKALVKNPRLQYHYLNAKGGATFRLSKQARLYTDLDYVKRTDIFVGYKDYSLLKLKGRFTLGKKKTTRLKINGSWTKMDYPNAFAFDKLGQALLQYRITNLGARVDKALNPWMGLWIDGSFKNQSSTDPRYDYQALEGMLGVSIHYHLIK